MSAFLNHLRAVSNFTQRKGALLFTCDLELWIPELPNERQHYDTWRAVLINPGQAAIRMSGTDGLSALEKVSSALRGGT